MDAYLLVKTIHILSSTILFGTGIGIAFFMLCSHFSKDIQAKLYAARMTVTADNCFTLPAAIIQPLSGAWLISQSGYNWSDYWIHSSLIIYILIGACWLPVVWIQNQIKKLYTECVNYQTPVPSRYRKLFRVWLLLGFPAFIGMISIFFLMVWKPL